MVVRANAPREGACFGCAVERGAVQIEDYIVCRYGNERARIKREIDVLVAEAINAGAREISRKRSNVSTGTNSPAGRSGCQCTTQVDARPDNRDRQGMAQDLSCR